MASSSVPAYRQMPPSASLSSPRLSVQSASPIVFVERRSAVLFKTVLSGVGFMCDAYDLFVMNVLLVVLGCDLAVADDPANTSHVACFLSPSNKSALATAVLVGSVSPHSQHSTPWLTVADSAEQQR